ncbi:MAG: hypothetical protein ABIJ75_02260 [Actinomycetota bacterium]
MSPFKSFWTLPVLLALAGVLLGAFLENAGPARYEAWVVTPTVATQDGTTTARVSWMDQNGTFRHAIIEIPDAEASTVKIAVSGDEVKALEGSVLWPHPFFVAILGGAGLLLGVAVRFSLAGFGYVRGTGEPGESAPEDVREERGFYWRG